jgi:hypothetical protein
MHNTRHVHDMLRELPLNQQLAALVCCIVERRPQTMRALVSMSIVMAVMANASCLNEANRIALAEIVRDTADEIERGRAIVRV